MTGLNLEVDSLDGVAENLRGLYENDNGKFRLKVDGLEDVSGLKSAYKKTTENFKSLEKEANQYKKLGLTPEEILKLKESFDKAENERLSKTGDFDTLKKQMEENHGKEIRTREEKISSLMSRIKDAEVSQAIVELKGIPDLLLPIIKNQIELVEENGKLETIVKDKDGSTRLNSKNDKMTVKELLTELKNSDIFGRAFEASGATGTGASSAGKPSISSSGKKLTEMTHEERTALLKSQKGK